MTLQIPNEDRYLTPGCKIRIGRFTTTVWLVNFGWFCFSGNREICGWYITDISDPTRIRPIQKIDLTDIYFVEEATQ